MNKKTYPNGDVYEGDVADGKRNGMGKTSYADGKVEEGRWEDDKFVECKP
ncbi:MAG: hypothetical protein LBC52_04050 [Treponema sp.]|jgi:hypothetical protein|nr:hypothetical protein [Treponema sp.]